MTLEDERACAKLVGEFAYFGDHGDLDRVIKLFAEDGAFITRGQTIRGHADLMAAFSARPKDLVGRHLCGPPVFLSGSEDRAEAVTYMVLYETKKTDGRLEFGLPAVIADYHDKFRRTDAGWRFAERKVHLVMDRKPAA